MVFANSTLCQRFDRGDFGNDAVILGDSAYGAQNYICKPLLNPATASEYAQVATRNPAERTIGGLKRVFPCLAIGMRFKLEKSQDVIVACCILYNFKKNSEAGADAEIAQEERDMANNASQQLIVERNASNRYLSVQKFLIEKHFILENRH